MISPSHIPNIISALRILSAPVLLVLIWLGQQYPFAWLLAAALISDILDGAIARYFGFVSELGSLLDSVADLLIFVVAAIGIWRFHPELVAAHLFAFLLVVTLWVGGSLIGYLRYGRMASFHTILSRLTAYLIGAFVGVLFLWGFQPWLLWAAVGLCILSHAEEFLLMALLPTWTPNARGLYWVLRKRAPSA
jgi:CDP-diacylglycerol--glycerol-3-phosphate 3-phosphatidyltransferase